MKEKPPLQRLVESFDDDDGLPENAYNATCDLLQALLGDDAAKVFASSVGSANGRFWLKSKAVQGVWQRICESAR
jgi:hypothetical protein